MPPRRSSRITRTERTYYVVVALWNLPGWFMHPVYPMFLLSRGLDLFEIALILAIFQISTFLFEVPTGAVADLYGRKVSFLLSCLIRLAAFCSTRSPRASPRAPSPRSSTRSA